MQPGHLFLTDINTGHIRFTQAGRERYAARFAAIGLSIDEIRNLAAFEKAIDALFRHEMNQVASAIRGKSAELDAILAGLPGWDEK